MRRFLLQGMVLISKSALRKSLDETWTHISTKISFTFICMDSMCNWNRTPDLHSQIKSCSCVNKFETRLRKLTCHQESKLYRKRVLSYFPIILFCSICDVSYFVSASLPDTLQHSNLYVKSHFIHFHSNSIVRRLTTQLEGRLGLVIHCSFMVS
jgi:hypothetical protein